MLQIRHIILAVALPVFAACGQDATESEWTLDDELPPAPAVESARAYVIPTGVERMGIEIEMVEPDVCVALLLVSPGQSTDIEVDGAREWAATATLHEHRCEASAFPTSGTTPTSVQGRVVMRGETSYDYAQFYDVELEMAFEPGVDEFPPAQLDIEALDIEFE